MNNLIYHTLFDVSSQNFVTGFSLLANDDTPKIWEDTNLVDQPDTIGEK